MCISGEKPGNPLVAVVMVDNAAVIPHSATKPACTRDPSVYDLCPAYERYTRRIQVFGKVVRVLRVQGKTWRRVIACPIARSRNAALGTQGVQYGRKPVCDGYSSNHGGF